MNAEGIVNYMFENDPFSQWLGIKLDSIALGKVQLSMKVSSEMCNGFGIAHGGICFSLADSALAFAANTHGKKAYSVETSIQMLKSVRLGDELKAESRELVLREDSGVYEIKIYSSNELVSTFQGTVYRGEAWEL